MLPLDPYHLTIIHIWKVAEYYDTLNHFVSLLGIDLAQSTYLGIQWCSPSFEVYYCSVPGRHVDQGMSLTTCDAQNVPLDKVYQIYSMSFMRSCTTRSTRNRSITSRLQIYEFRQNPRSQAGANGNTILHKFFPNFKKHSA